jgi:hypothetical protein
MASIALDDSVAFRVDFAGPVPPRQSLYFRGPVLAAFDGRTWLAGQAPPSRAQAPELPQLQVMPAVPTTGLPVSLKYVMGLDRPGAIMDIIRR